MEYRKNLTFEQALSMMRQGCNMKREGWKNRYVSLRHIDGFQRPSFIAHSTDTATKILISFTNDDILAEDWMVIFINEGGN